ncbi:MAG: hypothetical protein JRI25_13655 [Deltaproteobacteria bacterium]|nr:hypothetical protein [Deltaproteobacteria bacterium]
MRSLSALALTMLIPMGASAQEAVVDWPALEQRTAQLEQAEPSCSNAEAATETNDAVAAMYTELQVPLSHPGVTAEDFTTRVRATVLMRRVAQAGSLQLLALERCCLECSSFSTWQLDAMRQSMEKVLLSEIDQALTELGADPTRRLCNLLPDEVSQQRAVCGGETPGTDG